MPEISVIMLTYNRENLVSRAIKSMLEQTFRDFELIIVDNGSSDNSGVIADAFAQQDPRVRVVHRCRGSIGAGRNTGLDVVRGKYVTFCDDDDYVEVDYLEFLYTLLESNDADISICGRSTKCFDCKLMMDGETAIKECLRRRYYTVGLPTKLIRRELFADLRFSESDRFDDIGFTPYLFSKANRVVYHGIAKYIVDRTSNNNSSWTQNYALLDAKTLSEYLRVYRKRTCFLCDKYPDNTDLWWYYELSFKISMVEKINRYSLVDCHVLLADMVNDLRESRERFLQFPWTQDFERDWMNKYVE